MLTSKALISLQNLLPPIPAKRYFTIGEVGDLCGVKPHVLRYWEQEFAQLRPMKRRGNRRYYQHQEVLMIRRIRNLLYEQGFTISGARNQLHDAEHVPVQDVPFGAPQQLEPEGESVAPMASEALVPQANEASLDLFFVPDVAPLGAGYLDLQQTRLELIEIRQLLSL